MVVVGDPGDVIVAAGPLIRIHNPVPITGVLAAIVVDVAQIV